ncbi:PREDICTED: probable purine permease [Prunus dulcis]|uniref:PREDICTED: probable purine permease n=1 Tax=Prunus dulcis TaxID=3755 RepID=A0A5E4ELZ6_PRUDU|nr:hypothetical protein L3X38_023332 [Prunus dulcis]VVA16704.1 PREDICTED: probable purine permease [Prunus dulcis]
MEQTPKAFPVYVSLGLLVAFGCFLLYSLGLSYLPVSTYSLICASQLAFNALFSFFLNSQKFTPYIFNTLVLLTISSVLLVFQGDSLQTQPEYIVWQLFAICGVGLIFEASSLFSNVVSTLGLPVVPVLAVIFFHDKMDRIKVLAMVLAIWGFVSDLYQHYLDDRMSKTANNENAICER